MGSNEDSSHSSTSLEVEVIGWLYQFYISEKKDEVFDGLKKNKKITPENIPAATQLFTPHWIVKYLVENSLGRLWMLNRPNSRLADRMEYYIRPDTSVGSEKCEVGSKKDSSHSPLSTSHSASTREEEFLRIEKPEEIKICDPACGSGHMLTYAFDLLYAIYEEEGVDPAEIPEKILTNNLYGIEIDERAGELAAFALTMKARSRSRRFFRKAVKPNICVLENVKFDDGELAAVGSGKWVVGSEKQQALHHDLHLFEEADNFGSLLRPQLPFSDIESVLRTLHSPLPASHSLFEQATLNKVKVALEQASYLSPKYHVVIANPPYMGGGGMNGRLKVFSQDNYPNSRADLFAMFIERNLDLARPSASIAMITMQSWMSLSSFEKMRVSILNNTTIASMAHLGARAFDSIGGEVVSTTAFVIEKQLKPTYKGAYLRLVDGTSEGEKKQLFKEHRTRPYLFCSSDYKKIPSSPIAYWLSEATVNLYSNRLINEFFDAKEGVGTRNDEVFMRMFWEVPVENISRDKRWILTDKAGDTRRWYMGFSFLMDWEDDGYRIKNYRNEDGSLRSRPQNTAYLFREGVTWGKVGTGIPCFRWRPEGYGFNDAAPTLFGSDVRKMLAQMNSNVVRLLLDIRGGTINNTTGVIGELPFLPIENFADERNSIITKCVDTARYDWDSFETSWAFTSLPLLNPDYHQPTLKATYQKLRAHWREMTLEMQRLEEENNRIFIDAYGLQDELTPEVPLNEITLTCNPHYRYGIEECEVGSEKWEEMEARLLSDTMRELVSYAVGCMFGRYALDKPGLILANQGETIEDYHRKIGTTEHTEKENDPSISSVSSVCSVVKKFFPADEDNVIPMLDGDWFTDDIAERFRKFLRVAFGEEHYEENLRFVEQALNIKGKRNYSIRDYFLGEFYTDHVKRYKKRPIYWLFSSPKGSFNALIYMHRYRPDTVSVVLNDYLREFRTKLTSHKNHLEAVSISASSSQGEKTKALKEIEKITKMIAEMEEYEREVLYPLATEQVEIDLDDGVKVNYPRLGKALKKIPGL
ncbi:BREX-1 system adenine-specific DNA-methyltransferase PglX [Prosthecochloris vibrioformis]|uniref:BREX-1 system adenine-specific DNA-methyltransferase PglX n=1 Tax=Prosthecochloris vibrioformis TaxID=1098 RepID=UPI001B86C8AA|nr:BREX-1 system adenine-specific DNA-methyltransferase PglX [Prosthecochloris vibrioformis]